VSPYPAVFIIAKNMHQSLINVFHRHYRTLVFTFLVRGHFRTSFVPSVWHVMSRRRQIGQLDAMGDSADMGMIDKLAMPLKKSKCWWNTWRNVWDTSQSMVGVLPRK